MPLKIERERIYGGPGSPKRFHYVAYLRGHQIATGDTRENCIERAESDLLGAFQATTNTIYASVTDDGHIVTTREYQPDAVCFSHHRETDGSSGSCHMSRVEIDGRRCSVRDYHKHYLDAYNEAVRPVAK